MRIVILSPSTMAFNVRTPEQEPLGGIGSCCCYLAVALAARGHDMTMVATLPEGTPQVMHGVNHVSLPAVLADPVGFFQAGAYDAVITANYPELSPIIKKGSPRTLVIPWMHVFPDQPAAAPLAANERFIDAVVCVSASLRDTFKLANPTFAIGNAIAPFFEKMFSSPEELLAAKQNRAVYASMPFRGLDLAVSAMASVRGKLELDIYSSMRTYQVPEGDYALFYDFAKRNPRVHYRGGVGQRALAEAFRGAAYMVYPSTFIESYCIVAQEALAAGLKVISNDLGALPETTMGFADLLPVRNKTVTPADHLTGIVKLMEKSEGDFTKRARSWAEARFAQVQTINQQCTWAVRALQWEQFLAPPVATIAARIAAAAAGSPPP